MNPRNYDFETASLIKQVLSPAGNVAELQFDMAGLECFIVGVENTVMKPPKDANYLPLAGKVFTVQWRESGAEVTRVVRSTKAVTVIVPASNPIKVAFDGFDVTIGQSGQ